MWYGGDKNHELFLHSTLKSKSRIYWVNTMSVGGDADTVALARSTADIAAAALPLPLSLTTLNVPSEPESTGCCCSCCETPALATGLVMTHRPYHLQLDTVHVIITHPNEHVRAAAADLSSGQRKNTSQHYQPSRKTGTIRKITHF